MSKSRLAVLLCGCLFLSSTVASGAGYAPEVGEPHPEFILPKISNRQPASLAQFRGKKVLLIQFASW